MDISSPILSPLSSFFSFYFPLIFKDGEEEEEKEIYIKKITKIAITKEQSDIDTHSAISHIGMAWLGLKKIQISRVLSDVIYPDDFDVNDICEGNGTESPISPSFYLSIDLSIYLYRFLPHSIFV